MSSTTPAPTSTDSSNTPAMTTEPAPKADRG
jgi:hypothetical protein